MLILLFTAIFATISVIEDRREGFLQSVLVAPIPRWSMVLGKLLGGTLIAVAQGSLFVLLGYTLHLHLGPVALVAVVAWMFVVALALTALGFVLAWRMDSTQGFHAVMSVLLLPMWLLSGAFFPAEHGLLHWIILLNPLTYGVAGLRRLLYWDASPDVQARRRIAGGIAAGMGVRAGDARILCCNVRSGLANLGRANDGRLAMKHAALIFWLAVLLVGIASVWLVAGLAAIRHVARAIRKPSASEGQSELAARPIFRRRASRLPDFVLTDQNGHEFHSSSLAGKVWVASFFFASCPGPCYRLNQALAGLQAESDFKDVRFVSITCDPDDDTPEALKDYAARFAANPKQWTFLTGDLKKILDLGENRALCCRSRERSHSELAVVFDKNSTRPRLFPSDRRRRRDADPHSDASPAERPSQCRMTNVYETPKQLRTQLNIKPLL